MTIGLTIVILAALFVACAPPTFAQPTANNFGVADASGYKNTCVEVLVNITNVQSGPVTSIIFDIAYDKSVINVVDVQTGALTSLWGTPMSNNDFLWGTRVSIIYDGQTEHALQDGSTGSVALLNFSVIGESGETSMMDFTDIQLAGPPDYQVGTAPAKNGTSTVLAYGLITGHITDNMGTTIEGVTVTLTMANSSVMKTTTTDETGYYSFTTLDIGEYCMNFSKLGYWENTATITIESGGTETVDIILWKKGDLNNNGISADAGDLAKMKDASVGKITPDWKYDLNTNGLFADAGDLAKMKDASVGKIELL
ncbi:MAG: carboxypeptidase regulatory-like domain-containing protein [Euryarchaeota archaeon]|nr:carboxypeptidase regulatory-like domain-containing protein [Euryarchaeota archaeon]